MGAECKKHHKTRRKHRRSHKDVVNIRSLRKLWHFSRKSYRRKAVFSGENEVGIDDTISVGYKCQSAEFLMKHENMNRQEEYQSDGNAAMKDQNDRELVQDHSEQAGSEGN